MTKTERDCTVKASHTGYEEPVRAKLVRHHSQRTYRGQELSELNAIQLAHLLVHMGF